MNQYLAVISLPAELSEEFVGLIPAQRKHVNHLIGEGTVTGYSLALDRSKLWITLVAETEQEAAELLAGFPLSKFFRTEIHPLAFHQSSRASLLKVSLN
jgi:muconolactone delta-isomerase